MNKRNTAITLSVVSSIILASIGFEIISNGNNTLHSRENSQVGRRQLRLTSDYEDEIALTDNTQNATDEDTRILQYLNRQKDQKAKKIQELTQELNETKERLQDLKKNIVIRGGEKEQEYQKKIENLETQLKDTEAESEKLKANLAEREALIENKRVELENLSKIFTQTHSDLEKKLQDAEIKIRDEQKEIDLFIMQIQEKMSVNAHDSVKFDNLEQLLHKLNEHISGLQAQVDEASNNAEIEKSRANDLQAAIDAMHKNYEESQTKINSLEEQYNDADQKSQDLLNQLQVSQKSTSKMANDIAEMKKLKKLLADQESKTKDLEAQLSQTSGFYKIEQQRANDLEAALKKCSNTQCPPSSTTTVNADYATEEINDLEDKLRIAEEKNRRLQEFIELGQPNGAAHFKQCAILSSQQEKLIQDLEKNLSLLERRNKELEQQLAKIHQKEGPSNESTIQELKMRLKQSNDRIEQLQGQIAAESATDIAPEYSKNKTSRGEEKRQHFLNQESKQIIEELKHKQAEMHDQIAELKKALMESKGKAPEQPKETKEQQPKPPAQENELLEKFDELLKEKNHKSTQTTPSKVAAAPSSDAKIIAMGDDLSEPEPPTTPSKKPLTDKEREASKKLKEKQDRVASLEKRLQKLQNLMATQSEGDVNNNVDKDTSSEIFKAKIAYLTTRLTQEKMKLAKAQQELDNL